MQPLKPFSIGPAGEGLRRDLKPISIPEDAFETLEDIYVFYGRLRRRRGYTLLGRLSHFVDDQSLGDVASAANPTTVTLDLFNLLGITDVGANVIPGPPTAMMPFTITIAAPASYTITESPDFPGKLVASPSAGFIGGTIDYNTGIVTLSFSAIFADSATTITMYWANNLPAMGLRTRELDAINAEDSFGFDQTYAYRYSNTLNYWQEVPSTMTTTWSGSDSDFFWSINYVDSFWVTNNTAGMHFFTVTNVVPGATTQVTSPGNTFQVGDPVFFNEIEGMLDADGNSMINGKSATVTIGGNPFTCDLDTLGATAYISGGIVQSPRRMVAGGGDGIRYYTGSTWVNFAPPVTATEYLKGALLLIPYRGYLVALGTLEGTTASTTRYDQRARYCQLGTPYYTIPVPTSQLSQGEAWRDDIFGRGGAIDASTNEQIIGAEFVRDILVVYFERSTFKLRFTQNSILPFVWERVNIELGAEGTFSLVPFDKGVVGVGSIGIVTSDANSTSRIDAKIPEEVFRIENDTDGPKRVHGIRTYPTKLVYWSFPNAPQQLKYPNRLLVWNYQQNVWAIFNDSFTCFGRWQSFNDLTWRLARFPWATADQTWSGATNQALYENIIGGNQQGFVEIMEDNNRVSNDPSLVISNITSASPGVFTSTNHNISTDMWVRLTGIAGVLNIDGTSLNNRNYKFIKNSSNNNTFTLLEFQPYPTVTIAAGETDYIPDVGDYIQPPYRPFLRYSVEMSLVDTITGAVVTLQDNGLNILTSATAGYSGTVDYKSGEFTLTFPALANDNSLIIRVIGNQNLVLVNTMTDATASAGFIFNPLKYYGGGYITRINGINARSKFFNFFQIGQKARLSRIDFYVNTTFFGEFTANIYADANTSEPVNIPFPENLRMNVVSTNPQPNSMPDASQRIYRLFCECTAQTYQLGMEMSDQQLAHPIINQSEIEIPAWIFWARPGGRIY